MVEVVYNCVIATSRFFDITRTPHEGGVVQKLSEIEAAESKAKAIIASAHEQATALLSDADAKAEKFAHDSADESARIARTHGAKFVLQAQQEANHLIDTASTSVVVDQARQAQAVRTALEFLKG